MRRTPALIAAFIFAVSLTACDDSDSKSESKGGVSGFGSGKTPSGGETNLATIDVPDIETEIPDTTIPDPGSETDIPDPGSETDIPDPGSDTDITSGFTPEQQQAYDECMTEAQAENEDSLQAVEDGGKEAQELVESLAELAELLCESEALLGSDGAIPPGMAESAASIAANPESSEAVQALGQQVEDGELTWQEWWDAPQDYEGGDELLIAMSIGADVAN